MKLRFTPALGALAACLGAAAIVSACDASSTEGDIPPLTGVRIDTLGLLGGDSCGTADGQIAKLAVLLEVLPPPDPDAAVPAPEPEPEPAEPVDAAEPADGSVDGGSPGAGAPPNGAPLSKVDRSAVFDCFAEPTFLSDAPVYATFRLRVFGISAAAFASLGAAPALGESLASQADVVATCVATQQANVRATAVCTLDRDSRSGATPAPDAGPSDAGDDGDAGSSDAGDAGDASTGDAGDAGEPTDAGTDAGDGGR